MLIERNMRGWLNSLTTLNEKNLFHKHVHRVQSQSHHTLMQCLGSQSMLNHKIAQFKNQYLRVKNNNNKESGGDPKLI